MKSQISFPEQTSTNIKNSLNLFNINNLIQQQKIQQLHQQHLIQQQLIKQQLQNQNQSNFNNFINYQIENATQNMEIQEQLSPSDLKIQSMFIDQQALIQSQNSTSLNTSSCSSTIELPIINQNNIQQQQCSPMNTSSYEISPISTPTTVDSPISCSSPISNYSQSSPIQCTNQQIINQTSINTINTTIKSTNNQNLSTNNLINQLINQKQPIKKATKLNLTINKIDQNMLLVDNPKKRMRKTPIKRINKTNSIKQINSTDYILELEKNKLNFDESSCSSNSMNSEYCNLNNKKTIDPKKRRQRQQANERERKRMNSINKAFDVLKDKLLTEPINHKLSKMEILKLAQTYIKQLEDQLKVTKPINQFIQSEISTV